jgi:predicted nucleic acid-binding protein
LKVLDTDTCIQILRGNPSVLARREAQPDDVATTWIITCELAYGAANSLCPEQNRGLVKAFLATLPVLALSDVSAFCSGARRHVCAVPRSSSPMRT